MAYAPMKIAVALIVITFACLPARAGEATPPKDTDRTAKVLRSLDGVREQLGKAREQIERLEMEIQGLREELAGIGIRQEEEPGPPRPPAGPVRVIGPVGEAIAGHPSENKDGEGRIPIVFPVRDVNFGSGGNNGDGDSPPGPGPPHGDFLLVVSPEGDRVVAFETRTRQSMTFTLSNDKTSRHQVTPVVASSIVGLAVEGPKITRLAVFANKQPGELPTWHPVELREPVEKATPVIGDYGLVLYTLGHRVYAYSRQAEHWDVLELPRGIEPQRGELSAAGPTFVHDGHIYIFVNSTGKWADLDTRAILDLPADKPK